MCCAQIVTVFEGRKWIIEIAMAASGTLTAGFQTADLDVEAGITAGAARLTMAALAGLEVPFRLAAVIDRVFPGKAGLKRGWMDHEGGTPDVAGIAGDGIAVALEISPVTNLAACQVSTGCVAM